MKLSLERLRRLDQEPRFGELIFHRDAHLDAALKALRGEETTPILMLGGETGIGREYFCEAVAHRARAHGEKVGVWHLDLDGFEPESDRPLARYLTRLLEKSGRLKTSGEKLGRAIELLRRAGLEGGRTDARHGGPVSEWMAAIISLLLQFDDLASRFAAFTRQPASEPWMLDVGGRDLLEQLLNELTQDQRLIVQVRDPLQLSGPMRDWWVRWAEADPDHRRLLVFATSSNTTPLDKLAPGAKAVARLELTPLSDDEGAQLLAHRFGSGLPVEWCQAVAKASQGRPVTLAALVAETLEQGSLRQDQAGHWTLTSSAAANPPSSDVVVRELWSEIDARLQEEGEVGEAVRQWLFRAALCGAHHIPAAPILEHLAVAEEVGEEALDFIDDVLVETYGWLEDLEYRHPAFQECGMYTFSHPLLGQLLLDQLSEIEREMQAISLLRFLEQKIAPSTRGASRLMLALAEHLDDNHRRFYEAQLSWWTGPGGFEALGEQARASMQSGEVDPDLVWQVVSAMRHWPAERRLTLLEAYGQVQFVEREAVLPFDAMAHLHLLRAELLLAVNRPDESIREAEKALSFLEDESYTLARCWHVIGAAHLREKRPESAAEAFEKASEFLNSELGAQHPETLAVLFLLAMTLREVGEVEESVRLQEELLETKTRLFGEHHPETWNAIANLAMTLHATQAERAAELEHRVLDASRQLHGEEHPRTTNLMAQWAMGLKNLGAFDRAAQLEREILAIRRGLLGEKHPETLSAMANLAASLTELDEYKEAIHYQVEVLEAHKQTFGEGHPATLAATSRLAATLETKGDAEGAAELASSISTAEAHLFAQH